MPTHELYLPPRAFAAALPEALSETIHPLIVAWRRVAGWVERARQRQVLAALDDHMLRDIGITRTEAERECGKRFWQ